MELEAATVEQVRKGKDGKFITIEADVGGYVKQIKEIRQGLHVRYSEPGEYFVVYHEHPVTHRQELLTTSLTLDQRLVDRLRYLTSGEYDYLGELERLDDLASKEKDYKLSQQIKEKGEELAHALRKDLGYYTDAARSRKTWGKGIVGHANNG